MTSDVINIDKNELGSLIRGIVKEELSKINEISDDEQSELENLYGDSLCSSDYDKNNCIRF